MASFDRSHTRSYSSSIVIMTIPCIVSEIKRVDNRDFFIPPSTYQSLGKRVANILALFFFKTDPDPRPLSLLKVYSHLKCVTDRQTDGRTEGQMEKPSQ